jgi:hypothetical protein
VGEMMRRSDQVGIFPELSFSYLIKIINYLRRLRKVGDVMRRSEQVGIFQGLSFSY